MYKLILTQVRSGAGKGLWKWMFVYHRGKRLEILAQSPQDLFWNRKDKAIRAFRNMAEAGWARDVVEEVES